ncbi:MAG: hypothetical protein GY838_12025 [bacterium]|nr:hypothetical protein [bacterium]
MFTQRLIFVSLVCLFASTAFADQAAPGDAPVIRSGSQPTAGLEVVQLEEMWRAGGEDGDVIFGHIFRATADGDGNVYLVDTQLSEVPVFSPTGEHIKTLSREGEGPGETREPLDAIFLPDGSLGILQRFPGKVVRIDTEGTPLGDIFFADATEGGFTALYTGRSCGDQLMFVIQRATRDENRQVRTFEVGRYDAAGNELARCFSRESVIDFDDPVIRESTILDVVIFGSTIGPDGRVYVSTAVDRFAINVYEPDGALHHVIEREFEKRPRTDLESGRIQSVFDLWANRGGQIMPTEIYDCAPTIADLYVDAGNNLWVEHSRSAESGPGNAMLTYDVFDENGAFTRQVALACEGDPLNDELFRVRDDMVVLIKGSIPAMYASMAEGQAETDDEAAEANMEVICYRIPD